MSPVDPSHSAMSSELRAKYQSLHDVLSSFTIETGGLIVAYSGGVDSALLLAVSAEVVNKLSRTLASTKTHQIKVTALTALSPSYPQWEREPARQLAERLGVEHLELETAELDNPQYRANAGDRCFHCKTALFDVAELAQESEKHQLRGGLIYGAITDDLGDHRPGMDAAKSRGVRAPLIEAGLNKGDVRALSKFLGLPTWDKPASACLSSRFPYGIEVTAKRLDQVGRCESRLHTLGLSIVRARYHHELVRLEFGKEELARIFDEPKLREQVNAECKATGFKFVSIDLEGYRSGSANESLVVLS